MARRSLTAPPALPLACTDVRDRLADLVLGAVVEDEARDLGRHLEWCAGCRKELGELEEGIAAVGLALEPIAPPAELEDKVLRAVGEAAGLSARERRRFRIVATIAVVMSFVAVVATGWAATVAGRLERLQNDSRDAQNEAQRWQDLLRTFGGRQIMPAPLGPVPGRSGGGQAIVYLADDRADWVLVIAGGLPREEGPYSASLVHGSGIEVPVGRLYAAREGQISSYRFFGQDLTSFRTVVVTNGDGLVVLRGTIQSSTR